MAGIRREAKVTSKGQITVPLDIRRHMKLRSGDKIVFETDAHGVRVKPVRSKESPFAKYAGIGNPRGIPNDREGITRYFRELRGHDDLD